MAKAGTPRRRWGGRDVALVAVFAALTCVLGLIPPLYLPISPAPITAQTLGVMLAGAVLGGKRAAAAMALVVALVAAGLPVLSGGRGGLAVFAGPTVGFLVGWIPAAALTGWLTARFGAPYTLPKGLAANAAGGIVALYAIGLAGMMATAHLGFGAALLANVPFLAGDAVKAVLAAAVARGVHAARPGLLPARRAAAASQR